MVGRRGKPKGLLELVLLGIGRKNGLLGRGRKLLPILCLMLLLASGLGRGLRAGRRGGGRRVEREAASGTDSCTSWPSVDTRTAPGIFEMSSETSIFGGEFSALPLIGACAWYAR